VLCLLTNITKAVAIMQGYYAPVWDKLSAKTSKISPAGIYYATGTNLLYTMSTLPGILKELHEQFTTAPAEATAQQIMQQYFGYINATQAQQQLWQLTHGAITNDLLTDTQTAADRHNLIFFYEYTSLFINAVYFLHSKTATDPI
jgi:hypothetical protein